MTGTGSDGAGGSANVGAGIALMLVSVALFVVMDGLVKHLTASYPVAQVIFFRNLLAFVPIIPMIARDGGIKSLKTAHPIGHMLRAAIGLGSMTLMFFAYKLLPLTDAITIAFAAPLMMTALSVPLLKESVGWRRWAAVAVGFVGVVVAVGPGSGTFQPAVLLPLAGAFGYAMVMIIIRRLSESETSASIVFYFKLFGAVVSGVLMPFQWVTPNVADLGLLILVGLTGGVAQLAMTYGLKYSPVSILAPFEYTALVWGLMLDVLVWSLWPSTQTLIGAAIISAAGLYIVHRETLRGSRGRFRIRFARLWVAAAEREADGTK